MVKDGLMKRPSLDVIFPEPKASIILLRGNHLAFFLFLRGQCFVPELLVGLKLFGFEAGISNLLVLKSFSSYEDLRRRPEVDMVHCLVHTLSFHEVRVRFQGRPDSVLVHNVAISVATSYFSDGRKCDPLYRRSWPWGKVGGLVIACDLQRSLLRTRQRTIVGFNMIHGCGSESVVTR